MSENTYIVREPSVHPGYPKKIGAFKASSEDLELAIKNALEARNYTVEAVPYNPDRTAEI
jgi:hypothetical protein